MTTALEPLVVAGVPCSIAAAFCDICLEEIDVADGRVTVAEGRSVFARICVRCAVVNFDPEIRKAGYAAAARTSR